MDEKDERIKQLIRENKRLQEANKSLVQNLRDAREKIKQQQDEIDKQNQVQDELSLALNSVNQHVSICPICLDEGTKREAETIIGGQQKAC